MFRGGIYRYLHLRVARPLAILFPAVLFACMHANLASLAPLAILGVAFALVYEHTGDLGAVVIGHALFNANAFLLALHGAVSPAPAGTLF